MGVWVFCLILFLFAVVVVAVAVVVVVMVVVVLGWLGGWWRETGRERGGSEGSRDYV